MQSTDQMMTTKKALTIVYKNGSELRNLSEQLQKDEGVVLTAVAQSGDSLRYADVCLLAPHRRARDTLRGVTPVLCILFWNKAWAVVFAYACVERFRILSRYAPVRIFVCLFKTLKLVGVSGLCTEHVRETC